MAFCNATRRGTATAIRHHAKLTIPSTENNSKRKQQQLLFSTLHLHTLGVSRRSLLAGHGSFSLLHSISPSSSCISGRRNLSFQSASAIEASAPAASTSASTLEALSAQGDTSTTIFAPLVPYVEALPSFLGMAPDAPHAYVISIFVATIIMRTLITLPVTLWSRARTQRMLHNFMPEWEEVKRHLPQSMARKCRKAGLTHQEYKDALQIELRTQMRALLKKHKCSTLPTIGVPLAVNIPLFITASLALRTALLVNGSSLSSEIIPWWSPDPALMARFEESAKILQARGIEGEALQKLTMIQGPTLNQIDKTMFSPIGLGMMTLINVELGQWLRRGTLETDDSAKASAAEPKKNDTVRNDAKQQQQQQQPQSGNDNKAPAETREVSVQALRSIILGNTMRAASIAFVVVASQAPVGLVIYWLASASYTLIQNVVFAAVDSAKRRSGSTK